MLGTLPPAAATTSWTGAARVLPLDSHPPTTASWGPPRPVQIEIDWRDSSVARQTVLPNPYVPDLQAVAGQPRRRTFLRNRMHALPHSAFNAFARATPLRHSLSASRKKVLGQLRRNTSSMPLPMLGCPPGCWPYRRSHVCNRACKVCDRPSSGYDRACNVGPGLAVGPLRLHPTVAGESRRGQIQENIPVVRWLPNKKSGAGHSCRFGERVPVKRSSSVRFTRCELSEG